jgi:hypothetical protein
MTTFYFQKLRADTNTNVDLVNDVTTGKHFQGELWGAFTGLFGLAGNEIFVVSSSDADDRLEVSPLAAEAEVWQPTARPLDRQPLTNQGLYVFRRFHVAEQDVDEVVALSKQAWTTFEVSEGYAAEPYGLFKPPADEGGIVRMMLVTWYDGFASWETSRNPAPDARDNFRRRHQLTHLTYAVATRLIPFSC